MEFTEEGVLLFAAAYVATDDKRRRRRRRVSVRNASRKRNSQGEKPTLYNFYRGISKLYFGHFYIRLSYVTNVSLLIILVYYHCLISVILLILYSTLNTSTIDQ